MAVTRKLFVFKNPSTGHPHPQPAVTSSSPEPVGLAFPPPTQLAKTTLFASGNEADVRKSAAGDFFQCTSLAKLRSALVALDEPFALADLPGRQWISLAGKGIFLTFENDAHGRAHQVEGFAVHVDQVTPVRV